MAEGALALHAAPLFYARRALLPDKPNPDDKVLVGVQRRVFKKVREDLAWVQGELGAQIRAGCGWNNNGLFLVGDHLTAADTMMAFSVGLCLERVTKTDENGQRYNLLEQWLSELMNREAFKTAAKKLNWSY